MGIVEEQDFVKTLHKKSIEVILSCKNNDQLESAIKYTDLAKKIIASVKSNTHRDSTIFNNIIKNLDIIIRLKIKMLRYNN
tara:strand:- start:723 stop:965 length:243 start_codon:yes stop_codon:yes gene_type:complete